MYILWHVLLYSIISLEDVETQDVEDEETADLVTFTEEILNEKLHFLCSDSSTHVTSFRLVNWNIDIAVLMLSKKINFAVFLAST